MTSVTPRVSGRRQPPLSRRAFRDGIGLSVVGFGGMVLVGMEQSAADRIVADSVDRGVNYFDVAPFYGDGQAETKLGIALMPYRQEVFLACKTLERSAAGATKELDRSLRRLRTDHFDLYQFHAVTESGEVDSIFAPRGAVETFLRAREQGKVRYLGFSAHSVAAALSMMDRFDFDSILFPVNFVLFARGNFGPQVMQKARQKGLARLALKALAHRPWRRGEARAYPNCWYRPIDDPTLALKALRFTLSEEVVSAIPPGDERLFRMTLDLARRVTPMSDRERRDLLSSASGLKPLMRA